MRHFYLFHGLMISLLSLGSGFCTRDIRGGSEPYLLVRVYGDSDGRYGTECTVFLDGVLGSTAMIEVETNSQWFIDDLSIYGIPDWCSVSLPSGILTGYGDDKSLMFTLKSNGDPVAHTFDLILRHASDPDIKVTIHVNRSINAENN